ncbi:hypothetical protein CO2235_MP70038 [Cupriavidus oxalaticus]|uniref:Uncharacterized protein n=1 Tax=Cupriavidus oxalaticus TaxID=96344 RepID=A0A375GGS6_9BURK|nr:hypothetical protein CO2235_MP70038 [Cupriavidus oxalaticus]
MVSSGFLRMDRATPDASAPAARQSHKKHIGGGPGLIPEFPGRHRPSPYPTGGTSAPQPPRPL